MSQKSSEGRGSNQLWNTLLKSQRRWRLRTDHCSPTLGPGRKSSYPRPHTWVISMLWSVFLNFSVSFLCLDPAKAIYAIWENAPKSDPCTLVITRIVSLDIFWVFLECLRHWLGSAVPTGQEAPSLHRDQHRLWPLFFPSGALSITLPNTWSQSAVPRNSRTYACGGILGIYGQASVPGG